MPFFNFQHNKSMETLSCHSNHAKMTITIKTQTFNPPAEGCHRCNLGLNGPVASEEMSFESADVIRQTTTTDNCLFYKLPRSLRLW